ncbi:hypothetical protein COO16_04145 [Bacillus pseudomycoides]|uniref:hypothetical protein n=1 Tax=Bacillus pseudomycoides TaxID=64104 RepID=UPI000BED09AA|nr:hypothetical protein [Bacillus pseudomycoides]PDY14159.1 hypothetical protein COO16_04145 [Bacillus pseudomycoides]
MIYKIYNQYNEGIDQGAIYVSCQHNEDTVAKLLQFLDEQVIQHENNKVKSSFLDEKPLRNILCNYYGFTVVNPSNCKDYTEIELERNRFRQDLIDNRDCDWFYIEGLDKIIEIEILEEEETHKQFVKKIKPVMAIEYADKHLVEQEFKNFSLNELKRMKNYLYVTFKRLEACLNNNLTDKWNVNPNNFLQKAYSDTAYCKHCHKDVSLEIMHEEDMCIQCYCKENQRKMEESIHE